MSTMAWAENFLAHFVAHCEFCAQDVENVVLVIRVCCCNFLREGKNCTAALVFFLDNSEIYTTLWR